MKEHQAAWHHTQSRFRGPASYRNCLRLLVTGYLWPVNITMSLTSQGGEHRILLLTPSPVVSWAWVWLLSQAEGRRGLILASSTVQASQGHVKIILSIILNITTSRLLHLTRIAFGFSLPSALLTHSLLIVLLRFLEIFFSRHGNPPPRAQRRAAYAWIHNIHSSEMLAMRIQLVGSSWGLNKKMFSLLRKPNRMLEMIWRNCSP